MNGPIINQFSDMVIDMQPTLLNVRNFRICVVKFIHTKRQVLNIMKQNKCKSSALIYLNSMGVT